MTCSKEKIVLVTVYEEKPRKNRLTTKNTKHHHHHHHHHHQHNKGNRRAELLSYSQHLRHSSKLKQSTPPHQPNSLVTNAQKTIAQVKKQSSRVDMKNILKCFAISQAKRKIKRKKKKKKKSESSSNKARVMIKRFNATTQKGARRFFTKLKAFIQKHR
ncbi:hypothetical protein R6Q59_021853 [Mikania micrantha]